MRSSCFPCKHEGWGCQGMGVSHESIPYIWATRDLSPQEKQVSQSRGVLLLVRIMTHQPWEVGRAWESNLACREGKTSKLLSHENLREVRHAYSCPLANCPRSPVSRCGGRESCFCCGSTASPLTPAACSTLSFAEMQSLLATAPSAQVAVSAPRAHGCVYLTRKSESQILHAYQKRNQSTHRWIREYQSLTWPTAREMVKGVQMISIQSIARARDDKEVYVVPSVFFF